MQGRSVQCSRTLTFGAVALTRGLTLALLLGLWASAAPAQDLLWAGSAGAGGSLEFAYDVAVAPDGSSFVGGQYNTGTVFGAGQPGETVLAGDAGINNAFLARYDAAGQLVWVRGFGGVGGDTVQGVGLDAVGRVYVCGRITNQVVFGSGEPHETTVTALGGVDGYVARFGGDGAFHWVRLIGAPGSQIANDIAVAPGGDLRVVGSTFSIDPGGPGEIVVPAGDDAAFVARLAADGSPLWGRATQDPGPFPGLVRGVTLGLDASGRCVAAGDFTVSPLVFGAGEPGEISLENPQHSRNGWVASWEADGSLAWARQVLLGGDIEGLAMVPGGHSYMVGTLRDHITTIFDPGGPGETSIFNADVTDAYIARYTPSGDVQWVRRVGGDGELGLLFAVAGDAAGHALATGRVFGLASGAVFGAGDPEVGEVLAPADEGGPCVLKISPQGALVWSVLDDTTGASDGLGIGTGGGRVSYGGVLRGEITFGVGSPSEAVIVGDNGDAFVA